MLLPLLLLLLAVNMPWPCTCSRMPCRSNARCLLLCCKSAAKLLLLLLLVSRQARMQGAAAACALVLIMC
jgi:hypothetical protein